MISRPLVGRVLTLRVRHAELLQALAASALVFGCKPRVAIGAAGRQRGGAASPLGTPSEVYGCRMAPVVLSAPGETKWAVQIGPDGRVVSVRQMLTVEEFGMARVGEWTMQDVLVHFGKPTDSTYFPLMRRKVWSYRFEEDGVWYSTMHFYFDPDGLLVLTQVIPDFLNDS
jgi:hypothetical protein